MKVVLNHTLVVGKERFRKHLMIWFHYQYLFHYLNICTEDKEDNQGVSAVASAMLTKTNYCGFDLKVNKAYF